VGGDEAEMKAKKEEGREINAQRLFKRMATEIIRRISNNSKANK
jgi:hypothetical protein